MDGDNNSIICINTGHFNSKGCLNVVTSLVKQQPVCVSIQHIKQHIINISLLNKTLDIETKKLGLGLQVNCSIVCTVNKDGYLRVSADTLWLTPDMIAEQFDIYSNVVWKID